MYKRQSVCWEQCTSNGVIKRFFVAVIQTYTYLSFTGCPSLCTQVLLIWQRKFILIYIHFPIIFVGTHLIPHLYDSSDYSLLLSCVFYQFNYNANQCSLQVITRINYVILKIIRFLNFKWNGPASIFTSMNYNEECRHR